MANPVSFSTITKTFLYNLPGNIQSAASSVTAKLQKNAPFIIAQAGSYFAPVAVTAGSLAVILLSGSRTSKDSKIQVICGIATSILLIKVSFPVALVSVFCMDLLRDDILKNDQIKKQKELEKQLNDNETKKVDAILSKDLNPVADPEKTGTTPIAEIKKSSKSDSESESENEKIKNFKKPSHASSSSSEEIPESKPEEPKDASEFPGSETNSENQGIEKQKELNFNNEEKVEGTLTSHDSSSKSNETPESVKPLNLNDTTELPALTTDSETQEIEEKNELKLTNEKVEETITGEDFDGFPTDNSNEKIRDSFNDAAVDF